VGTGQTNRRLGPSDFLLQGGQQMQEYRAYVIGPDGHIFNRVDIRCSDEKERGGSQSRREWPRRRALAADRFIERF